MMQRRAGGMSRGVCLGICVATTVAALAGLAPVGAEQPADRQAQTAQPGARQAILNGYRRYNSACNHCHGPDGVGSTFAPSLIANPVTWARFEQIVEQGSASGASVMRGFADDPNVAPYIRDIWLYLTARAEGSVGRGRPTLTP
jgi:mono/diheme cytochrome c family protein